MKIAYLKFTKDNAPKIAALLSQYASVKTLISISSEDLFSVKITICIAASEEDLTLMEQTELKNYFKPF